MSISAAIVRACSTMSRAPISVRRARARAAASAHGPPEPTATRPSSGSMRSPVPERRNDFLSEATSRSASNRRSARSVRQSRASSTAARSRLPWYSSSFASKRVNSAKPSAAPPAKPARTLSLYRRRILRAVCFITVRSSVTCPSAPIATLPRWRTHSTVVAWIVTRFSGPALWWKAPRGSTRDEAHAGVDGARRGAVRTGEQRIDVHLLDLGALGRHLGQTQEGLHEKRLVHRRRSARPGEQGVAADPAPHLACLDVGDRQDAEHHVLQHLDEDAAQAEHQDGAQLRIARHAQDRLAAPAHHLLHLVPEVGRAQRL